MNHGCSTRADPFGPRSHHHCEGQPADRKRSAADAAPLRHLKLCGAGEWRAEKHGTRKRHSWRKLHLGVDAATGRIVASALIGREVDDGAQAGPLLDRIRGPGCLLHRRRRVRSGRCLWRGRRTASRRGSHRATALRRGVEHHGRDGADTRDRHLQLIAAHGRMGWQKMSGYTKRARVEAAIARRTSWRSPPGIPGA